MQTPFGWLAQRVTLGPRALRWGTTASLIASILIVVGGGVVRVTASGLGCPTWPTCTTDSLTPIPALGIHGIVEFTNRAVTGLLIVAVGWAIVAARLQANRSRTLTRLAWSQFWLVVINAVAGGITVLVKLNPWVVALHFVLAIGLLTTTALTWHRARRPGSSAPLVGSRTPCILAWTLAAAAFVLVIAGTIVSGAGPHSGDSSDVPRISFDWTTLVVVHATAAVIVIALAIVLLFVLGGRADAAPARRRVLTLLIILLLQGAIGAVQALTGLPSVLVVLHLLGAALIWVGVIRVLLDVDTRLFALATTPAPKPVSSTTL